MNFLYGSESPFWYFLAHRAQADAEAELNELLAALNRRADELGLPIAFRAPHSVAWAVLCRLFNDAQSRTDTLGRMAFPIMKLGFGRVFGPQGFVDTAFHRILANIQDPAFPGRARDDSVIDTFLANGLRLVNEDAVDPSLDAEIMGACLSDAQMHTLGQRACKPSPALWDTTVTEYSRRRPGWLVRQFTDPNKWLFD